MSKIPEKLPSNIVFGEQFLSSQATKINQIINYLHTLEPHPQPEVVPEKNNELEPVSSLVQELYENTGIHSFEISYVVERITKYRDELIAKYK